MSMLKFGIFPILCSLLVLPLWASPQASVDSAESGRRSLESGRHLPWYDADNDTLQRIDVEPSEDDLKRHSSWASDGQKASRTTSNTGGGSIFGAILQAIAWICLGLLVAAIIGALIWAATRSEGGGSSDEIVRETDIARSRIEHLPIPVSSQRTDLLAAAQAYFNAGDLGKAITYAFAHQLVELDKHHLIQLTKGKTNRQYLRELREHPRFIELLKPTMLAFEDVFFGHHELSRQRFQICWDGLEHFHQQLEQVAS